MILEVPHSILENIKMSKKTEKKKRKNRKPKLSKRSLIFLIAVIIALGIYLFRTFIQIKPMDPMMKLFSLVENNGFTPNYILSSNLLPGAIVQIKDELGTDGKERSLKNPILVFEASECFNTDSPVISPIPQIELSGSEGARINLSTTAALSYLPQFGAQATAIKEFIIHLGSTKLWSYPKGVFMSGISSNCARILDDARKMGDKTEWYKVVQDVIVSDSIEVEIVWKHEPDVSILTSLTKEDISNKVKLSLGSHSKLNTRLTCKQPIVI